MQPPTINAIAHIATRTLDVRICPCRFIDAFPLSAPRRRQYRRKELRTGKREEFGKFSSAHLADPPEILRFKHPVDSSACPVAPRAMLTYVCG